MLIRIQSAVFAASVAAVFGSSGLAQNSIVINKELFITDLGVVNHSAEALNENGVFHIRTLLDAMAPTGKDAKDIILSLLGSFRDTGNPDLPVREIDEVVINPWKRLQPGVSTPAPSTDPLPNDHDWNVDWQRAPFRLLAIVNRMDLRHNPTIGNAGEGRFVFGVVDPIAGGTLPFTVILEYLQPAASEAEIRQVAVAWHRLGAIATFDDSFVNELKIVTRRFTRRNAAPARINGSAIGQIRTNEIALNPSGGPGWELREFALAEPEKLLHPATVKLTPHHSIDSSPFLAFLFRSLGPNVSESLPHGLLDFRALTRVDTNIKWQAPMVDPADRILRRFSVNTCNGCHGGDGGTGLPPGHAFLHVAPRDQNQEAQLSKFLLGTGTDTVTDPGTGNQVSNFSDLEQRKLDFELLIGSPVAFTANALQALEADEKERSVRVH